MKHIFTTLFLILVTTPSICLDIEDGFSLSMLDEVISNRTIYTKYRQEIITDLKQEKEQLSDTSDIIKINREIIGNYSSFICDSAEFYAIESLSLAREMKNKEIEEENLLRLSYIYSLSGLFHQADEVFKVLSFEELSDDDKIRYCWNYIRYYENLIFYTEDKKHSLQYEVKKELFRDKAMTLLDQDSEEYQKELANKIQQEGRFFEAENILLSVFKAQTPETHSYAMASMNLAKLYKQADNRELENKYLTIAAITDIKLAVKENEALLSLAVNLYEDGDINRAYDYIRVALDDALFYNARFKNSVIARVQPIIEDTYLQKIYTQQRNLRMFSIVTSIFAIGLILTLLYLYTQIKAVSKARKELSSMNDNLLQLNSNLDEANTVKEHYIGYFMNQSSIYLNKHNEYRKKVNMSIKTGQMNNLLRLSTDESEKEIAELHKNFDKAFLALYPNFVSEFNSLLSADEHYKLKRGELNNELRIFALIKLGITDVKQIANFLHYSIQTVYNYRSRVRGKAIIDGDQLEAMIKNIGSSL